MEEKNKDIQVRCTINYEPIEENDEFSRYNFAIPLEDLRAGYTIGNNYSFKCTVDDEVKVINVIALEFSTVVDIEFEGYDDKIPCMVYGFVGLNPMTEDEFEIYQKEMEERRKEYEKEMMASQQEDEVEDVEVVEVQERKAPILDLTRG